MRTDGFRNLPATLLDAFKCITCRGMYAAVMASHYSGANFNEPVVWIMCTLEVFAGYTCSDALWCAAKIQVVIRLRTLNVTIQTEQPGAPDTALA